jgi:hypothetical protein
MLLGINFILFARNKNINIIYVSVKYVFRPVNKEEYNINI